MIRLTILLPILLACCLWLACQAGQTTTATIDELHQLVESGADPFVLDVRSDGEFLAKRMSFVDLHITHDSLQDQSHLLPTDKNLTIYCVCHTDLRSDTAVKVLTEMGYTRALCVVGGMKAWVEAGYETTGGPL